MDLLRRIAPEYRATLVALAVSATVHGAAVVGWRASTDEPVSLDEPAYTARLEPAATVEPAAKPAAKVVVARKPRPRPKPAPRPEETVALLPAAIEESAGPAEAPPAEAPSETLPAAPEPAPSEPPPPEVVAIAQPAVPVAGPELPAFRPEALPDEVTIAYALNSSFADGVAEYTWKRDGDTYEITGSAEAVGFFTLFLEGRIDQRTNGRVTPEGLRPERFSERRGSTPEEGLAFDWASRTVEFRRGDQSKTGPLTGNSVDWLSMIFQLAQMPPRGDSMELRVYTQRRLYEYRLQVVGPEELELPFGRARTLHLRHEGESPSDAVDVWLGPDHHYLPLKLRYPVARNRLVVDQTATSITVR